MTITENLAHYLKLILCCGLVTVAMVVSNYYSIGWVY